MEILGTIILVALGLAFAWVLIGGALIPFFRRRRARELDAHAPDCDPGNAIEIHALSAVLDGLDDAAVADIIVIPSARGNAANR